MTGSALFMGVPERVEVEPLQGCLQAARRQSIRIALHPALHDGIAFASAPFDAVGEGLQMDMKLLALFQAEQQICRTLQQPGQ